ncbi:MAG: S-layer homology domain-containing protein, partial [Oscillospiraceae bacterium]
AKRLNHSDGNEYAVYLYGGTSTVTGNTMSGFDSRLQGNYITAAISTAPYYNLTATITGNNIHDNMCGINLVGSWRALSNDARTTIQLTLPTGLTNSANAFAIGEALAAQNTLSNNAQGGLQLNFDQNGEYTDTRNAKKYGTPLYCSDFLSLASKNSSSATLSFASYDSALSVIANQKANTLAIEVSEDNGATWTTATTSATLGSSSTGATVTLASGKTYLLRAKLIISSVVRAYGSAETPVVYGDFLFYSNSVSATIPTPAADPAPTTQTAKIVEVDGVKQDAGTSKTETVSGKVQEIITVDATKLDKILESSGAAPTVTLPGNAGSDVVVGELSGQTVKNMETKEAVLEIKTDSVTYTLPASQINIDDVSSQLGSQLALKDIKVSVSIAEPSADTVKIVENTASKGNYQLVVKPVEFTITCSSGNRTVDVSKFNGYVERTVAIPDGVDPSKITTGIVLNADGSFSHVPTSIVTINGKYYAKINSLTNSTYSVIYNPVTFADVANHWAKAAINDMGSRMVVTGIGSSTYEPDRSITRAEFAAVVVRALGLQKGTTESAFDDVTMTDWFNGYVDTATAYSLITGYDSASYGPNDTITREQAMAIIARAMKLTGLSTSLTDGEVSALLANYADGAAVSDYAKTSTAICLKTGVVTGSSATALSPKAYVTRAEVAVMVQRMLQKSGLI